MSLSFQWEEAEVPLSSSPPLCSSAVFSWRLWERFSTTTVISHCSATDSFITQLRFRWVESPPMTSSFSGFQRAEMTSPFHLLLVSSVISMGHDGERFISFGELPLEVNVFGAIIRKCMQIWCRCQGMRGRSYKLLKRWGRLLFDLHTNSCITNSLSSEKHHIIPVLCLWSSVVSFKEPTVGCSGLMW